MNIRGWALVALVGLCSLAASSRAGDEHTGKRWQQISTEELRALMQKGAELHLVDVLPPILYDEAHIPGSINIPFGSLRGSPRLPKNKHARLVFYCMGTLCMYSPQAADLAHELGYTDIRVYRDGLIGWQRAGLPVASKVDYPKVDIPLMSAAEAAEAADALLVDIRPADNFAKGHAKGSVNIDLEVLGERLHLLPRDKRVVLVDHKGKLTLTAGRFLVSKGMRNVYRLDGGFNGWVKSGLAVNQTGEAPRRGPKQAALPGAGP